MAIYCTLIAVNGRVVAPALDVHVTEDGSGHPVKLMVYRPFNPLVIVPETGLPVAGLIIGKVQVMLILGLTNVSVTLTVSRALAILYTAVVIEIESGTGFTVKETWVDVERFAPLVTFKVKLRVAEGWSGAMTGAANVATALFAVNRVTVGPAVCVQR